MLAAKFHAAAHRGDARVRLHAGKLHIFDPRALELRDDLIVKPNALDAAAAVDEQHLFAQLRHALAKVRDLPLAEVDVRGHMIEKVIHLRLSFCIVSVWFRRVLPGQRQSVVSRKAARFSLLYHFGAQKATKASQNLDKYEILTII